MRARHVFRNVFVVSATLATTVLSGCPAVTSQTVRPVQPPSEPEPRLTWPSYVGAEEVALLEEAERRIADDRQGDLLLAIKDSEGFPIAEDALEVRWELLRPAIGLGVRGPYDGPSHGALLRAGLDTLVAELPYDRLAPEAGKLDPAALVTENGLDVLPELGMHVIGAGLVAPDTLPKLLRSEPKGGLAGVARKHVERLVGRLRGHVRAWEVVRDPHGFGLESAAMVDFVRQQVEGVRAADSVSAVLLGFTDLGTNNGAADGAALKAARAILEAGLPIDGFVVHLTANTYLGREGRLAPRRDLVDVGRALAALAKLGKSLTLVLGAPAVAHPTDAKLAGYWGRRWDPDLQASYARALVTLALAIPEVRTIAWSDVLDATARITGGGLFQPPGEPRPVVWALSEIATTLRSRGRGTTTDKGELRLRGFAGQYLVTLTHRETRRRVHVRAEVVQGELRTMPVTLPVELSPVRPPLRSEP